MASFLPVIDKATQCMPWLITGLLSPGLQIAALVLKPYLLLSQKIAAEETVVVRKRTVRLESDS